MAASGVLTVPEMIVGIKATAKTRRREGRREEDSVSYGWIYTKRQT